MLLVGVRVGGMCWCISWRARKRWRDGGGIAGCGGWRQSDNRQINGTHLSESEQVAADPPAFVLLQYRVCLIGCDQEPRLFLVKRTERETRIQIERLTQYSVDVCRVPNAH